MTLSNDYLDYPHRRRGYDHDLYKWSALKDRPPVAWPGGRSVAVWPVISAEWFPIVPDGPFRAPGHMVTPYPDYRHYTARDYGTRIGIWRLLAAWEAVGARVSVAMNAAVAERAPELVAHIRDHGHEIIAHSTDMNGTIDSTLDEADERALIAGALDRLEAATGTRPRGWLSIARQQSFRTPALLAEAGVEYVCDWVNDELPYRITTPPGGLVNLPLNHELSDRQIVTVQQQSADSYAEQMRDAWAWLDEEARVGGGRMLPLHQTPYILGLPYRIGAVEGLVEWLAERAWVATGAEVLECWKGQG